MITNKKIEMIARDVERSGIEYTYELDGEWVFTIYQGCWSTYKHTKDSGGVTMKYKNSMGYTYVHTADLSGVGDTLINVVENFNEILNSKKMIDKYLSSDEGAWGRD